MRNQNSVKTGDPELKYPHFSAWSEPSVKSEETENWHEPSYKQESFWDKPSQNRGSKRNSFLRKTTKQETYFLEGQKTFEAKYTIFVGNITSETTEDELVNVFAQFGKQILDQSVHANL